MSFKNGKNIWLKTGLRILSEEFFSASGLCFFVLLTSPPRLKITISKAVVVKNRTSPKNYYYSAHRPARQNLVLRAGGQFSALFPFSVSVFGTVLNSIREQENARLEYFGTVLKSSDSQLLDQQLIWNGPYSKTDEVMLEGSWFWKSRPSVIEIYFGRDLQFPAVLRIKL